ncbi:hypothetical protein LINPERHAP2_LOCUS27828 [Linum perenne]
MTSLKRQHSADSNPRCPKICFSNAEIKSFYRPWSKALVVKVLERTFSFFAVKRRLETLWARNGSIQVSNAANSFFLVRFADPNDYQRAAFQGPWKIYDYYFSVARWTPSFNEEEPLKTILTWVRLPKLPIHYFNQVAVTRIGNCIGRTVRLDLATAEGARGRYARVCVEVDVSKPLLGKYMIENCTLFIEYESLENICVTCGHYGHKADICPSTHGTQSAPDQPEVEVQDDAPNGDAGEWMIVQRRSKNKAKKVPVTSSKQADTGSRFAALAGSDEKVSSAKIPMQVETVIQETEADSVTSALAAQLAAVLAQAPCMQKATSEGTSNKTPKSKPRQPLADIPNGVVGKNKKEIACVTSLEGLENSSLLINVLVIYDNPTFQGSNQSTKTTRVKKQIAKRNAGVASREKPDSSAGKEGKNGKQLRSFVARTLAKGDGSKAGKPPDRS